MGIGLEDGSIHIYSTNLEQINSWKLVGVIDDQSVLFLTFLPNHFK